MGAGLLSAGLLGLTGTGTLSSISAQVLTGSDTVGLARMVLELRTDQRGVKVRSEKLQDEKPQGVTSCRSDSSPTSVFSCTSIQPLGGRDDLLPGESVDTDVVAVNRGRIQPSSFTLSPGPCEPTGAPADDESRKAFERICELIEVRVVVAGEEVFDGPAAKLRGAQLQLPVPAAGEAVRVGFTTTASKEMSNAYQGLGISMPMTWGFAQ